MIRLECKRIEALELMEMALAHLNDANQESVAALMEAIADRA